MTSQILQSSPPQTPPQQNMHEKHTPVWLVILLFFLFSPVALVIMFKEKYYHKTLPILLWIYAIVLLLVVGSLTFVILPKLSALYAQLQTDNPISFLRILNGSFLIILIGQILFGFWARKKVLAIGFLSKKILTLCLLFILIDAIAPSFIVLSIVEPIYKLTSSIDTNTVTPPTTHTPTPTTNPTANWKTYTNPEFGFEISAPPDWIKSTDKSYPIILYAPKGLVKDSTHYVETIVIAEKTTLQPKEWLKGKPIGGTECCIDNFTLEEVSLNDHSFSKVSVAESDFTGYVTKQNGTMYYMFNDVGPTIACCNIDKNDPSYKNDVKTSEKILSTFKFTNQTSQKACTKEAKLCPDGKTFTGRMGPDCEFAVCPKE